ncbi:MAG: hypothetical protein LBC87_01730 [Fibromonadaceae bacterium]|jgi:hypothetical protein|nr:hypothetical protein [Fibromonadaceae bacterium]
MKKVLVAVALMTSISMADTNKSCKMYNDVMTKKVFASDLKKQLDLKKIPIEYYTKAYYAFYRNLVATNSEVFREELTWYPCVETGLCPYEIDKEVEKEIEAMSTRLDFWYKNYCANYEWHKRNKVFWLRDME